MTQTIRQTVSIYCETCGGTRLSCTAEWIDFGRLTFCSPDCRDDHASVEAARRDLRDQVAALRRIAAAAARPSRRRAA